MGRTPPERNNVIFGCVRPNGEVDTEATGMEVPLRSSGIEIVNGRRGTDKSKEGGTGFTTDAVACNIIALDFEETLKDLRVMRSEAEGKGFCFPG
jgi:hypothetical protein